MTDKPRQKGVRIPIPFDQFVSGVLKVDPKTLPPPPAQKRAAKKANAKKR